MKLDFTKVNKDIVSESRKKEIDQKIIFSHRILPHKGHLIWKFNTINRELSECEFIEDKDGIKWKNAVSKDYKKKNRKVLKEVDCIYFSALNRKNAVKVLAREYNITI